MDMLKKIRGMDLIVKNLKESQSNTIDHETSQSIPTDHETPQSKSPIQGQMTIQYVQAKIRQFEKRFNALKKCTRECLERLGVPVKRVADALTSLPADDEDEHKQFLESHLSALYRADNHSELFGAMNFHWNYQNPQLLDHLIREFDLEGVKGEMKTYKEDLHQFRKKTPLKLFCQSHKKKRIKPQPDFHEVVAEFDWPDVVTLEVVEEFRQEYAEHYSLHKCAMMLDVVLPGSFIATWFIPDSIVEKLKVKVPASILKNYSVTRLEVAGECVYPKVIKMEQSSRREIEDLKKKLQSIEAKAADLEKIVQQRDFALKILRQKEQKLRRSSLTILTELQNTLMEPETRMLKVSGPGLRLATANHPTHVIVELTDSSNRPCSVLQTVTAELEFISQATPISPSGEPSVVNATVTATSPSQYEVSYTAVSRGQYKLHIQVNDEGIDESLNITVYPDPNKLANPVDTLDDLITPYSIGFTSNGEMIISEKVKNQISIFNTKRERIGEFEQHEDCSRKILHPRGIAIDDCDNVYVSSEFKLQKFTSRGEFIKCVGQEGSEKGEFNGPHGLTLHDNQLYVCDCSNHRIQVFDLDLNFIRSIGSKSKGEGEFQKPYDVKFDDDDNMYVAEWDGGRVQVLDKNGKFIRFFDENEFLKKASGLHIIDKYVYVSDWSGGHIVVYETSGRFVTSFGGWGYTEGKFLYPYCINSYEDQVYICDRDNGRIQIF